MGIKLIGWIVVLVVEAAGAPSDWFYAQRAYPYGTIPQEAVRRAFEQARQLNAKSNTKDMVWQLAGPVNIGGRITAIAVNPLNYNVIYVGAADGGVFKSVDGGQTWTPVFDSIPFLSIGSIAVDPIDTATIYVGTGETNGCGDSFDGDGLYVSHDGGVTWEHLGLHSPRIARIVVNPLNDSVIYVAAMGHLFSTDTSRGVYKSTDRGRTWRKILFINDTTGCIDISISPLDTNIIYAAMWQRFRTPESRIVGGEGSGIYRSTDGGETWVELTNGLPSGPDVGRIGLAISPSNPSILYAIYADHPGYFLGLYKTTDGGDTWTRTNDDALSTGWLYYSYGWYFGQIRVDPLNPNVVYALGIWTYRSTNGGNSWEIFLSNEVHLDHHAFWICPTNPNFIIDGNDGGVYITRNGGTTWQHVETLPITQFYDIAVDANHPERLYGGTQDNGTLRTLTGNIDDWEWILGGDGFHVAIDPRNSNVIYAEWQYGALHKSTDGGYSFYEVLNGVNRSDRRNWDTPFAMDPSNPDVLYYGTFRIYKTVNGASYWEAVSGDLTNGSGSGNLVYGTITAIKVSPADGNYIYVGTDDGRVWVSPDGGATWTSVDDSLPDRYVTDIGVHPTDPLTFYVTFSGYSLDDRTPYIFVTHDLGQTWTDITDNLPQAPVNAVEVDPSNPNYVYVGTDFGVYYSNQGGGNWAPLGSGLPYSVVMDLAIHNSARILVAGTHGRSMFKFDLNQLGGIAEDERKPVRNDVGLKAYANWQERTLRLDFALPFDADIQVKIFDVSGRRTKAQNLGHFGDGRHTATMPLRNLKAGVYFLVLEARSMDCEVLLKTRFMVMPSL